MFKYIYIDESGDLGFGSKSSKFFVITLMAFDDLIESDIGRIIKKTRIKILKKKMKRCSELKGNNSQDSVRKEILTRLSQKNIEVYAIILEKSKVFPYLKEKKNKLYNYMTNLIINECSFDDKKVTLVADRRGGKAVINDFNRYVRFKLSEKDKICELKLEHKDSKNDEILQVLDFVCWAIFRKYESNETRFYDIIKNKIVTEKPMFQEQNSNGP